MRKKLSISLAMIVRNVEPIIGNALDSIADYVHEIVIVDTGSTDSTKRTIEQGRWADKVTIYDFTPDEHPESFLTDPDTLEPMLADFASARNASFAACKSDYIIWIDSDDIVQNPQELTSIVHAMEDSNQPIGLLKYLYDTGPEGHVTCELLRERIIRRGAPVKWVGPVHECLAPIDGYRIFDSVVIEHKRRQYNLQPEFSQRNLKILRKWIEKQDPKKIESRFHFYLGMETRLISPQESIEHFNQCCRISKWSHERSVANLIIGEIHESQGSYAKAFDAYGRSSLEDPQNPDPLFGAARIFYQREDWQKCIQLSGLAFNLVNLKSHPSPLMHNPLDRTLRPHCYLSYALIRAGRFDEAIKSCEAGLRLCPLHKVLKNNLALAKKEYAPDKTTPLTPRRPVQTVLPETLVTASIVQVCQQMGPQEVSNFISSLPAQIRNRVEIKALVRQTASVANTTPDLEVANFHEMPEEQAS